MKKRNSVNRGTKHSTESGDGSQGGGGVGIRRKKRPPPYLRQGKQAIPEPIEEFGAT